MRLGDGAGFEQFIRSETGEPPSEGHLELMGLSKTLLAEARPDPGRSSGQKWAVEIKWRGRRAGVKELQRLLTAAGAQCCVRIG